MKYTKPHLPYDAQLRRIAERGMPYSDEQAAIRALRHIGYYRLSAYTYPFRDFRPVGEDGTPTGPRPDTFREGSRFEDAVELHDFDQRLRRCLAEGLEEVEIGLRTKVAYTLGKRDPFGHLNKAALVDPIDERDYGKFLEIFRKQRQDATQEEYVKHFLAKYDGEIPIWVAAEFMSFGLVVRLYELLHVKDAWGVAKALAVEDRNVVHKYLKALNVLRNDCAHHCRVWNRATVYPPKKPPRNISHERILHIAEADQNRLYPLAVLTAHFAIQLNPQTRWPARFRDVMKHFPGPMGRIRAVVATRVVSDP